MNAFKTRLVVGLLLCGFVLSSPVVAEAELDRESAFMLPDGTWSFGIFNPTRYQINKTWAVETHPLGILFLPHVTAYHHWASGSDWALTGRYGLAVPSWSLRFGVPLGLKGYLAPACLVDEAEPDRNAQCMEAGWAITPTVGAAYSIKKDWTFTVDADLAAGLMLSGDRPLPLDSVAAVDMSYAPLTHSYRAHVGLRATKAFLPWLRAMFELDGYRVGIVDDRSPWALSAFAGVDFQCTKHMVLTLGTIYWNHDQRAMVLEDIGDGFVKKAMVRSHDFLPTIDLIWTY